MADNTSTTMMGNMSTTPMSTTPYGIDLDNYTCNNGLILPIINEYTWTLGARAFFYFIGMLWFFLGVSIIADVFMCSIERITSKTTTVRISDSSQPDGFRSVEVKVWNSTVANLTLLALGTSAPEILLSVIELFKNKLRAGELGPGTIVGSAAFNLLFISAICIVSIPDGETRKVARLKVFAVTAFSCIFAYVWLSLVLIVITPNVVDIWEAVVTLLFFPVLVITAYLADRDCCMKKVEIDADGMVGISLDQSKTDEETGSLDQHGGYGTHGKADIMRLCKDLGHESRDEGLPPEEAAKIAANKIAEDTPHDRLWYRINATRGISGGKKLIPKVLTTFQNLYEEIQLPEEERTSKKVDQTGGGHMAVVEFTAAAVSVLECDKKVRIGLRRCGKLENPLSVRVETINGTALAQEDYIPFNEEVKFAANEQLRQIFIEIVDDFEWEPDEFFFVKIVKPYDDEDVALGNVSICQVTIINDDEPGKLEFAKPSIIAAESSRKVRVPVNRINGADGHVSVKWSTKDITAVEGKDYKGGEGVLVFDNGEISRTIDITLYESNKPERDESFQIELGETDGGAELGKITKTIVTIVNDEDFNGLVNNIYNLTMGNLDYVTLGGASWVQQFREAMNVNGGDIESATFLDYILHFCTFFWKILFAIVPPAKYWGGWPAFLLSLAMIGVMTALIGDLAGTFGCLIGLGDAITAITFVALGTSMPDTFASKQAAVGEKTADSSVGNVNGSNSVNVFLGLGLPWCIASIYWAAKGEIFEVPAGSLGFTVIIYTVCAILAIGFLILRRLLGVFGNAELGGPKIPKYVSAAFFVFLWVMYVVLSSLNSKKIINVNI